MKNKTWRRYYVEPGTDWWVEHYPADQMQRPTGPLCDGCHSLNYDIKTKTVTEWTLTAHGQWALATMTCCIVVAVLRLAMLRGDGARSRPRHVMLLAIGLVALVLIQQTAERGARLVYEFGTGVIAR